MSRGKALLRVGVVGVGYLGRFHAEKYKCIPGVELAGVVDVDLDRAREVAKALGTKAFGHHEELVGLVDAVSIVVPTTVHYQIAKEMLREGVDVLVEKPICSHLEEADELIHIASEKGAILQVGHLERFNPAVRAVRPYLREPLFIESHRISPFVGRGTDVDVVLELMIHDIDLLLDFIPHRIIEIDAVGVPVVSSKLDIVNARIRFDNGCVANLTASRVAAKSLRKIRIFQMDDYFSVDCGAPEVLHYRRSGGRDKGIAQITVNRLPLDKLDPLEEEIRSFVEACITRTDPVVGGREARRSLEVGVWVLRKVEEAIPEVLRERLQLTF